MDHTTFPPTPESFDIQEKAFASPTSSIQWESVAARRRCEILNKIPQAYLISQDAIERAGVNATRTSGVLDPREQGIVEKSATALLELIHSRQYSSVEVATAFCKSAALAHQLVRLPFILLKQVRLTPRLRRIAWHGLCLTKLWLGPQYSISILKLMENQLVQCTVFLYLSRSTFILKEHLQHLALLLGQMISVLRMR